MAFLRISMAVPPCFYDPIQLAVGFIECATVQMVRTCRLPVPGNQRYTSRFTEFMAPAHCSP